MSSAKLSKVLQVFAFMFGINSESISNASNCESDTKWSRNNISLNLNHWIQSLEVRENKLDSVNFLLKLYVVCLSRK